MQKIEIPMADGYTLVAEQNNDPAYAEEMYIFVRCPDGDEIDLVCVHQKYHYDGHGGKVMEPGKFRIFLADEDGEYRSEPIEISVAEEEEKD